jgi:putative hydrolase of the HAD superfamily
MTHYKHIIFDLDHTLWDFDANCAETLTELFVIFDLQHVTGFTKDRFIDAYKMINKNMWSEYHRGLISKEILRNERFERTFQKLGMTAAGIPPRMNEAFLKTCPSKTNLLPHAREVLDYLRSRYTLHILTNGFSESQYVKINSAGIGFYFKHVINSERCGFLKPDRRIFEYTLSAIQATQQECMMIGDDLEADILGARNAGIDHIYLNRHRAPHQETIMHEINCLSEVMSIL